MWIERIWIGAFGALEGRDLDRLGPGLNVILGPNESGKTTLREFILWALFGPARGGNAYEPLRGGRRWGRMKLWLHRSEMGVWLERRGDRHLRLTDLEGSPLSDDVLGLAGLDREAFGRVFAVGLQQMQGADVLNDARFRSRLFAAGAGLGGVSLAEVVAGLDREAAELLGGSRAQRPQVNQLLRRREGLRRELREAQRRSARHAELHRDLRGRREDLERLQGELRDLQRRRAELQRDLQLLPQLIRLQRVEQELEEIRRAHPEGLMAERVRFLAERRHWATEARRDLARRQEDLARRLRELGPGWTPERLRELELSLSVQQEIRELAARLQRARRDREEAQRELHLREQELAEAEARLGHAPACDEGALRERQALLDRLGELFRRRERAGGRLESLRQQAPAPGAPAPCLPAWPSLALALAALGVAAWLGAAGRAGLALGAGTATGALALLWWGVRRAQLRHRRELAEQHRRLRERLEAAERELAGLEAELREVAAGLGVDPPGRWAELEGLGRRLVEEPRRALEEWRRRQEELERMRRRRLEAAEREREAAERLASLQREWQERLARRGLPPEVPPEGVELTLRSLYDARRALDELEGLRRQLEGLEAELRQLLRRLGRGAPGGDPWEELEGLRQLADRWEQRSREREQLLDALGQAAGPEGIDRLRQRLRNVTRPELEARCQELAASIEEREEELEARRQEVLRLEADLERLQGEPSAGELQQRLEGVEAELEEALERWATSVLCRHLLEETRRIYERERQPRVIRQARDLLALMTAGRYRLLYSPEDGRVSLEGEGGERKQEDIWSEGLADQVYLCLRLAAACEWARWGEPLPVVLDDVLVRFDPDRQEGAARALLEVAGRLQVLLFTCHPEVAARVQGAARRSSDPPVQLLRLAEGWA